MSHLGKEKTIREGRVCIRIYQPLYHSSHQKEMQACYDGRKSQVTTVNHSEVYSLKRGRQEKKTLYTQYCMIESNFDLGTCLALLQHGVSMVGAKICLSS